MLTRTKPRRREKTASSSVAKVSSVRALFILILASGCVAPVQWQGTPREPPRFNYASVHGVPRAYGGGVCAVSNAHSHGYPPVPRATYSVDDKGMYVDGRETFAFIDPHPHVEGTCFLQGWHLHLRVAASGVRMDDDAKAYVAER